MWEFFFVLKRHNLKGEKIYNIQRKTEISLTAKMAADQEKPTQIFHESNSGF